MSLGFVVVFSAALIITSISGQQSPVITTKTGQVRGQLITLAPSMKVYQFTAIPFAEPPTGTRRFRKPVPKTPWDGVLDATTVPNVCPQATMAPGDPFSVMKPKGNMSEDCLYLNIWVPQTALDEFVNGDNDPTKLLSVFTFIHGGGFTEGATSIDVYNGTVLSGYNNVIVATIQYRLGSLGFAYLGNEQVPGNMGLWDQMEAMKWISENIASFGGKFNETTIGGESAGAASVAYHLLSPQSRRYFKRAIIESGVAIATWAGRTPQAIKASTQGYFRQIAAKQCPSETADVVTCLRSLDVETLMARETGAESMKLENSFTFGPVVDGDFVPRDPVQMLGTGDFYRAPLIIGANKDESSLFLFKNPSIKDILPLQRGPGEREMIDSLNFTHYKQLLAIAFSELGSTGLVNPLVVSTVLHHYWPTKREGYPKGREVVEAVIAAMSDVALTCPTYTWAQLASNFGDLGSQIYVYYFTHRRASSPFPDWLGVMHGDELSYVFGEPFAPYASDYGYSYNDKAVSRSVMTYWTNFVKFGDPNARDYVSHYINEGALLPLRTWPPYVGEECPNQIAELNAPVTVYNYGPGAICGLKTRDCMFWTTLFPKLAEAMALLSPTGAD